jgi:hypothetical protein
MLEPGKLKEFKHLNLRAIQPAIIEVNGLSDLGCAIEPVLSGRKVVKVKLSWWRKNTDELKAAYRELQVAKVGRRARLRVTKSSQLRTLGLAPPQRLLKLRLHQAPEKPASTS